jgi:superfamily I DNA/RNA helicase
LSFGKKNVDDLKNKINLFPKNDDRFRISTIHSLAFRHMNATKKRNMTKALFETGHEHGFFFGSRRLKAVAGVRYDDFVFQGSEPETDHDAVYNEIMRLRARMLKASDTLHSGYLADEVHRLWKHMDKAFERGLWDFTRLLEYCVETGYRPSADFVCVDEIQDCTKLQIEILKNIDAEEAWFVGDPDQSIYGWAGCDIRDIRLLPIDEKQSRSISYRVPSAIAAFADRVLDQAPTRTKERIQSKQEGGSIEKIGSFYEVCARLKKDPQRYGETFILARTNYLLGQARKIAEEYSLNLAVDHETEKRADLVALIERPTPTPTLSYNDLELLLDPMMPAKRFFRHGAKSKLSKLIEDTKEQKRRGSTDPIREWITWGDFYRLYATENLREVFREHRTDFLFDEDDLREGLHSFDPDKPRVMLYTMHASKGLEADTVVVIATTTKRVLDHENHDEEVRLAYVAVTRPKQNLILTSLDGPSMRQLCL